MSQYLEQFRSPLKGIMRWEHWTALLEALKERNDGKWYVYYVGEEVPEIPVEHADFSRFIDEFDKLLRREHDEGYFGIAYTDDRENPSFIKVYDPSNLGASCGSVGHEVLPGWTLSRDKPTDLADHIENPANRRRWWSRLFS
ncbi:MAG TPA: hypothetical protein ENN19_03480 [Chloroflexi bacterium]|nr:hypothetical protein [Chloroflexota bacterium]